MGEVISNLDVIVSHGVLDSVSFDLAKKAVREVQRVIKHDGLFNLDLISGDNSIHGREYDGKEIAKNIHETGTFQSYFNYTKILKLTRGQFD